METLFVTLIVLIGTILNEVPLLVGLLKPHDNYVFLGVVHHAQDYFYYLSQFAMGESHWFLGFDPLTSDFRSLTLVGWPNIFLGHIFSLIGIDHLYAYQSSVVIFTLLFLFLSYKIICRVLKNPWTRVLALFLFVFTNGIPLLSFQPKFQTNIFDFWFNLGNPLTRLGGVPHQLLANSMILAIFLIFIKNREKHSVLPFIILAVAAFTLATLNPVQWVVVGLVIFLTEIFEIGKKNSISQKLNSMIPLLIIFVSGLPHALYLKFLFNNLPYSQLSDWEAVQIVMPTLMQFILSYGLVGILGTLGIFFLFKVKSVAARLVLFYGLITFLLYFSPLATYLHLTNARFISSVSVLSLSCSAALLLIFLTEKLKYKKIIYIGFSIFVLILFIPEFHNEVKDKTSYFTLDNAYFYLPKAEMEVFAKAREISTEKDTFLLIWPFNVTFAGLTGRREYNGHPLMTINSAQKDALSRQFFSGSLTESEMINMLKENGITYVITYPWTFPHLLPFLHEVYSNQLLILYTVKYN